MLAMINNLIIAFFTIVTLTVTNGVPVPKSTKEVEHKNDSTIGNLLPEVSYKQYLAEVMNILEKDKDFISRVQALNSTDDLPNQLAFASHSVRTRLDEIKRQEVERLNALEKMLEDKLAVKDHPEKSASVPVRPEVYNMDQGTIERAHLDHSNPESFEISDLEKLIRQVTDDLKQVEAAKEEEYKQYEMNKEHEKRAKLRRIKDLKAREEAERKMREEQERHRRHKRVHKPGSNEQLKEAWEKEDHMDKEQFDPKTFFMLHDVNGDGHLDISEIEAIFNLELEKVYNSNDSTADKVEQQHEMERMRRTVMLKIDTNKDMMVSWPEFDNWTKNPEYAKDEDWEVSEESNGQPFNPDEFKQFEDEYKRKHPSEYENEAPQPQGH